MTSHLIEATDQSFSSEVLQSSLPVLVDFWGTFCPPCKRLMPIVEAAANEYAGKVKFVKIEVDNNRKIAAQYEIQAVPTLMIFRDGRPLSSTVGALSPSQLDDFIEEALAE